MTINGVTPLAIPQVRGAVDERSTAAMPIAHGPCDDQRISWDVQPSQQPMCRSALSSLRYQALQSAPVVRTNTVPPGRHSTDSQLASELDKNFGELHSFFKEGRLTQASLRRIAAQELAGD
ncbi:MAG: hypothetical protein CFE47_18405 [Pseudomonas sp. PGPPP1]|uniref:hypothetical protein n=1 Tax=Pseudomonas sp. PGPPP1 TaxID=2015553 RepID=UPI000BD0C7DD|nr:hypothetical protein [Pseudomonas sp. PGPPP1]OYU06126.1 MAG: hypothetical protein CFE47_18405 [Pseudomonas sp. PGPPP1]